MLSVLSAPDAVVPALATPLTPVTRRILVIDDDEAMLDLVGIALRERGFEVFQADSGAEGLRIATKKLPDLILCDVRMEGVTGYDVLADLRKHPSTATLPFILITANDDPGGIGMRQGMELGADDYLRKPFEIESLYATVDARLKKAEMIRLDSERRLAALRDNISLMLPHELRTPLNGMLAYGDMLISQAETLQPADLVEAGEVISESGHRLERLIENFLIYTQTELMGGDPQRLAALRGMPCDDVTAVIEERARRQAQRFGRPDDLDLELQEVGIPISRDYLAKVVDELVQNAFKFSEPDTPVSVSLAAFDGQAQLTVSDLGRGMSAEEISHIGAFMQFGRKHHEQQGLGLGLTIARRLAGLYGGEVDVQSETGQGTRVVVRLPVD
ncbi:MAG: hybrid sensor histidine kinase/response regulator [Verrucomicrobia bacterium]|jgi:signal transduction histidine kinase|nr:hybrid sensor histidine kinase/response regulator [Verrucomicrobiota bacterium]